MTYGEKVAWVRAEIRRIMNEKLRECRALVTCRMHSRRRTRQERSLGTRTCE